MSILQLPKSKGEELPHLIAALDDMFVPAQVERNMWQIGWWIAAAYVRGLREFYVVDFQRGELEINYEDEDGELHLRWDEPLTSLSTEIGRLSGLDTTPMVKKRPHGLESLRNSSIAQALLDSAESVGDPELFKTQFIGNLCMYGTAGIASWNDDYPLTPISQTREHIPPWELLGVPSGASNHSESRAIVRSRLFPLRQLLEIPGIKMPPDKNYSDLDIVQMPYGRAHSWNETYSPWGDGNNEQSGSLSGLYDEADRMGGLKGYQEGGKKMGPLEDYVRMREWMCHTQDGRLSRYIIQTGQWIALDKDYVAEKKHVPMPIGVARYEDIGRFYGRSFLSKIIPFALELERLLTRLMTNTQDLDRFGYVLLPSSWGVNVDDFKDTGPGGPGIVTYEEDFSNNPSAMQAIQPINASDMPGKTLQFGISMMERVTNQGPLYSGQAPGRSDSGEAFAQLAEKGSTNLLPIAIRIEAAYRTYYRSILFNLSEKLKNNSEALSEGLDLIRIENTMAGITIDPQTGKVTLTAEDLPDPWGVKITIKSRDPNAAERRRQEGLMMRQEGVVTPLQFIIMNYRFDWDFPVSNEGVWENYVKAVLYNLIMFNDGKTPGKLPGPGGQSVYFNEAFDKPIIHKLALEEFVASPHFALAHTDVQNVFHERWELLGQRTGELAPSQLPHPEDAAFAAEQAEQAQGNQAAQGQPPQGLGPGAGLPGL